MATLTAPDIALTPAAAARVAAIAGKSGKPAILRLSVEGGGCSGFQYRFDVTKDRAPDDMLIERDGARVLVDPVSLGFMQGAEIDFVDELIGAQFKINNPNVTASCGCGTSFTV